jgi:hypothetical protein
MEKKTNGDKFVAAIKVGGSHNIIENEIVETEVNLNNEVLRTTYTTIKNVVFERPVTFEEVNFNGGIEFINCEFKISLIFINCSCPNESIFGSKENVKIGFSNCVINWLIIRDCNKIDKEICFYNETELKGLQVENHKDKDTIFRFDNASIKNKFEFKNNLLRTIWCGNNTTIKARVSITEVTARSIVFNRATVQKDIHILKGEVTTLIFSKSHFEDFVHVRGVVISSLLQFAMSTFEKGVKYDAKEQQFIAQLKKLYIRDGEFKENLVIDTNLIPIEEVEMILSRRFDGGLSFENCQITSCSITGENKNGNIGFKNCTFIKLILNELYNYGVLNFTSCSGLNKSRFVIRSTNLGRTHFFNMFLDTFNKVDIKSSVLTEIVLSNVRWFKDDKLNKRDQVLTVNDHTQKREIYRQIKYALEKQGDKANALVFKAREMKALMNEMFADKKNSDRNWCDRVILWIGQTNDFGQNWWRPVYLYLIIAFLLYGLLALRVNNNLDFFAFQNLNFYQNALSNITENLPSFFKLLNPTHSLEKVFEEYDGQDTLVSIIDYVLKIVTAFFIYQTIAAFRKYTK